MANLVLIVTGFVLSSQGFFSSSHKSARRELWDKNEEEVSEVLFEFRVPNIYHKPWRERG